ncbi:MAG: LytTR family DNA-binding domain-containing protein [Saprospiraceae bacterium]
MEYTKHTRPSTMKTIYEQTLKVECTASDGKIFIAVANICAIEASGNHAYIHRSDADKLFVTNSLKELDKRLQSNGFCRVHRQYLLNIAWIHKYHQSEGGCIEMDDGKKYPISKSGKMLFWEMIKEVVL